MLISILGILIGFFRDLVLSNQYGASDSSDIYLMLLNIPIIIFATIGAAINTTYIPLYSEISYTCTEEQSLKFTNKVMNIILILCMSLIIIFLINAEILVKFFAMGFSGQKLELSQATESKNITVPMVSVMDLTKADIAIEFKDNQGNDIMESVTETGDFYVGDKYTVSADYRKDQVVKRDGKVYTYKYNAEKSVYTEDKLEENNIFTLVYDVGGEYDFYADFENYTIDDSVLTYGGGSPKLTVAKDNENSYLSYASTGSTVGVWQKLDTIDCTNKTVTVNADIKFAPKGTAGNSQFSIGDTSPKFDSNNVNYGFVNKSKKYDGHIIAVEYNSGSTLLVNGQTVSSDFVGSWIHLNAEINFAAKKINVTLKNDNDITAELSDLDFYSSNDITEIGSFYLRAAKSNGTIGLDNLTMVCE